MFAAICFLLFAASLGLLMGIEEARGFIFGNLVTTLGGHVTFAAIGWVTLAATSYRFIPAFILPKNLLPRIALWQVVVGARISIAISVVSAGRCVRQQQASAPNYSPPERKSK